MPKKVPVFQDEDQERKFWSTHDTADYFDLNEAREAVFPNLKPTTRSAVNKDVPFRKSKRGNGNGIEDGGKSG